MKPKEFEVIYKFAVAPTVPFTSALNWNTEPVGELIRCKDCKWYEARIKRCNNSKSTEWNPDDYCSDAKRKEE